MIDLSQPPVTTPGGHRRLLARLRRAEEEYRRVVESNPEAAAAGDSSVWHDNFAYEENQRRMHQLARRVRDLRALLASVRVLAEPPVPDRARIGLAVHVVWVVTGREETIVLAGYEDGDPAAGRISYDAPLGRALLGTEPGDVRTVVVAGVARDVEVLGISLPERGDVW
jgi:transcription elongation GreA/GreB family factor